MALPSWLVPKDHDRSGPCDCCKKVVDWLFREFDINDSQFYRVCIECVEIFRR